MDIIKIQEFIDYLVKAYKEKWWYVWGGWGDTYNNTYANKLLSWYGSNTYNKVYYLTTQMNRAKGRRVADCSGLCQSAKADILGVKPSQVEASAHSLYTNCKEKGAIGSIPNKPCLVFKMNKSKRVTHVGYKVVYKSKDYVIEMYSSSNPCLMRGTGANKWTHWGVPKWLSYSLIEPTVVRITNTSSYNDICWLQTKLNKLIKAGLVVDGKYGAKTIKAVKAYWVNRGWNSDNKDTGEVVGKATMKGLTADKVGKAKKKEKPVITVPVLSSIYTVKKGDNLTKIVRYAKDRGIATTVNKIVKLNSLASKDKISIGQKLKLK